MEELAHPKANVVELYPCTRGKRVLYVTNRADTVLQQELSKALQAQRFKFLVVPGDSPNRMRNMESSIASGTYDVVLFVEGFNSHKVYDKLVSGCSSSPTPTALVPVGKGRVAEVVRALSNVSMPAPRPPRNDRELKMPRWTGVELTRVEDLALEGKSDAEISLALKNEFDGVRTDASVGKVRLECFGIVRGRKLRSGTRKLPQDYFDLRQAQRIRRECSNAVAVVPASPPSAAVVEELPALEAEQEVPLSVRPTTPALTQKEVLVSITGKKGTLLVESKRPLHEIVAFLIGET